MLPKLFKPSACGTPAPPASPLSEIVKTLDGLSGRRADPAADVVLESYTEVVREDGRVTVRRVERRVEKGK